MPERSPSLHEQVRDAEVRFSTLIDLTADAVVCVDANQRIVVFNRAAEEMFGWAAREAVGELLAILIPEPVRSDHGAHLALFAERNESPRRMTERRPMRGLRKSGEVFDADISISNVTLQDARLSMAVVRDVSALKRMQSTISGAEHAASLGRLAAGLAHDFNNLLTVIRMSGTLLAENPELPASLREDSEDLRQAAERASELTRELLAYGRRQVMRVERMDLAAAVRARLALLERLAGEDIEVQARLPEDPAWVRADPAQIERVVFNLVANARDAMPAGGRLTVAVEVKVPPPAACARHPEYQGKPQVCLSVHDTGVGMSAETREHIFEPFFTTKSLEHGTGLGLASVKGIVDQTGGCIFVESAPGLGTGFNIWFPQSAQPAATGGQAAPVRTAVAMAPHARAKAGAVLLVDDEPAVLRLLSRVLRKRGFRVIEVTNASSAIAAGEGRAGEIMALVSDVVLPGLSGLDLAGELMRRNPHLAVVLMSGYSPQAVADHGSLPVQAEFLEKPFDPGQLLAALDRAFKRAWNGVAPT